jgi:cell fate (sporulation/competence/biofilm development) regulator YlbF (YheA/YmcA/DUF963 family)
MMSTLDLALDLLTKALPLIDATQTTIQSFRDMTAQLHQLRDEGRDPTDDERQAMKTEIDVLEARIYAQKP